MINLEALADGFFLIIFALNQVFPGYIIEAFALRWIMLHVINTT